MNLSKEEIKTLLDEYASLTAQRLEAYQAYQQSQDNLTEINAAIGSLERTVRESLPEGVHLYKEIAIVITGSTISFKKTNIL